MNLSLSLGNVGPRFTSVWDTSTESFSIVSSNVSRPRLGHRGQRSGGRRSVDLTFITEPLINLEATTGTHDASQCDLQKHDDT